jgi:hypothetical protein
MTQSCHSRDTMRTTLGRFLGWEQELMGSSNCGALCRPFLNSSPARAHDLSRESLADSPDRGRCFDAPGERMPGQGRLRGRHQPPYHALPQVRWSNVDDATRSSMHECTPAGRIVLPALRQGRLGASSRDAVGDGCWVAHASIATNLNVCLDAEGSSEQNVGSRNRLPSHR